MKQISILLTIIIISASAKAHDYIPGTKQTVPILLKNGNLHTVSDGYLPETDLLFIDGKITEIWQTYYTGFKLSDNRPYRQRSLSRAHRSQQLNRPD